MSSSARKLKVLSLVTELRHGGDENRLLAYSRSVDQSQIDHVIVTIKRPNADLDRKYGTLRGEFVRSGASVLDLGVPTRDRLSHLLRKLVLLARALRRLRRICRERDIDVLDAHLRGASLIAAAATFGTRVRTVTTLYGAEEWAGTTRPMQTVGRLILRRFDAIVTDSNARRGDVQEWLKKPHPRFKVIPNGVSPPKAERDMREMALALGRPSDRNVRVIGQVGRLVPFKGHEILLQAAKLVLEKAPDVFFVFVGFSPWGSTHSKRLREVSHELGIADSVHIGGYRGPIGDVWQLIDIHAHASVYDSMPNAIIEAMSLGKPSVVTAVGGIPDMVEHERTGLVVSPNDPQELADGLLRLLEDPDLAKRLGSAAFARYERWCRPEVVASQLESVFLEVTARNGNGGP